MIKVYFVKTFLKKFSHHQGDNNSAVNFRVTQICADDSLTLCRPDDERISLETLFVYNILTSQYPTGFFTSELVISKKLLLLNLKYQQHSFEIKIIHNIIVIYMY